VYRQSEDRVITAKDGRSAIALVDIAIDSHGALDGVILLQAANGDGKIIQNAETFAVVRVGVVKSTAHIDGRSILKRQTPGQNRPTRGKPDCSDQFGRIGDLQAQHLKVGEFASLELAQVFAVVNQRNVVV
jgi:hypothetical protein